MMPQDVYDTVIVGGGPAAAAAGVYAARKKMKTALITKAFGGQSSVSGGIENWLGEKRLTGMELAGKLEEHVRAQPALEVVSPATARSVKEIAECLFEATVDSEGAEKTYRTKTIIIASGSRRKYLNVPGEVDCRNAATSKQGIFAAGDVTTDPFKQNNIAAGDDVRAAPAAYYYLTDIKKHSPCAEKWRKGRCYDSCGRYY